MEKDSNGNALPNDDIGALTIRFFNLAVGTAVSKGFTVTYDKAAKTAVITDRDGRTYSVMHS
jgi:hypothetical protein